ncbi:pyocin knob domain-containing protein [Timonella senegalensis]|uniref:pyocin knob domain-containing protein n=1 Tax=Timonella senegalensis TaxID=1465825 RepID=UPI0012B5BAD4|nr:pyocin knob domain-containing protein [Timonella senegalensis]
MASFTSKPVEGQDPWAATDLAWRASVEAAVNATEATANAALPIKGNLGTASLDTVFADGTYFQHQSVNATLANGYPVAGGTGCLVVSRRADDNNVVHTFTLVGAIAAAGKGSFQRVRVSGAWQPWQFIPSQRVDQTAGRAIYTWDNLNNREQLVYGFTGIRNVSSLLENGWTGSLYLWRDGYDLVFILAGLDGAAATSGTFFTPPQGFLIQTNSSTSAIAHTATNLPTTRRVSTPGGNTLGVAASDYQTVGALYGRVDARTTNAWPTVLPGTAVGSIPNA